MIAGTIPEERHTLLEFRQRDLPGFAIVNSALKGFEPKKRFPWHLSLRIRCVDLIENKLPSPDEQQILYEFEDKVDQLLKLEQNALFLARVTHDGHRELIWRVSDPDVANQVVQQMLREKIIRASLIIEWTVIHNGIRHPGI